MEIGLLRVYIEDKKSVIHSMDFPLYRICGESDSVSPAFFTPALYEHDRKTNMRSIPLPTYVKTVNPNRMLVVSDLHFVDSKVVPCCRKEFTGITGMSEIIIERWNATMGKNNSVLFLGDLTGSPNNKNNTSKRSADYSLSLLDGRMTVLCGNHDM